MKIGGKKLVNRNAISLTLRRPGEGDTVEEFTVIVTALPMGWDSRFRPAGLMDTPRPPKKVPRNESGAVVVNPITKKADLIEDREDPAFVAEAARWWDRRQALLLREYLSEDKGVQFDAKEPEGPEAANKDAWANYADALAREVVASGLTNTEVAEIIRVGESLETSINLREALTDFLSRLPE